MRGDQDLDETKIARPADLGLGPTWAFLRLLGGNDVGRIIPLAPGRTSFGRSRECDVVLHDEEVSRQQFVIDWKPEGYALLRDPGSRNGTRVDDEHVHDDSVVLENGSRIRVGSDVVLKFSYKDRLEARADQEIYDSAVRDGLTRVHNKRYLVERLVPEFFSARRRNAPLSLIVFDIDHFKDVNDRFGHAVGDGVLQRVSARLEQRRRRDDILARYGGEEFVLVMRDTGLSEAQVIAERVRASVAATPIDLGNLEIPLTVSAGVACTLHCLGNDPAELFRLADTALYAAKDAGRNRVACAGPDRAA